VGDVEVVGLGTGGGHMIAEPVVGGGGGTGDRVEVVAHALPGAATASAMSLWLPGPL